MSTSRTYTTGAVLTAAQQNDLAQGTLNYTQIVANVGPFTAATDIVTAGAVTLVAGRRIKITGSVLMGSSVADDVVQVTIQEGATVLQTRNLLCRPAAVGVGCPNLDVVIQPGAGSHTYKITAIRSTGTGNITAFAAAAFPTWILVEDIGI